MPGRGYGRGAGKRGPDWPAWETELLKRFRDDGFTSVSVASILERSPISVALKGRQLGAPFKKGLGKRGLKLNLSPITFRALASCAAEIEATAAGLAVVVLNICARRHLWAEILRLCEGFPEGEE